MNQDPAEFSTRSTPLREEVSHQDTLGEKIDAAQARLDRLAAAGIASGDQEMVDELLAAFSITLEELAAAGEELRQQHDELTAAHENLVTFEERYRELFETAPGGYFVTDMQGSIREANRAAGRLVGIPPAELIGNPLVVHIAPERRVLFHRQANRLATAEAGVEWETRLRKSHSSEEEIPVLINGAVMRNAEQQASGMLWLVSDISALKAAQDALNLAERQALMGQLASSLAHEIGNPLQTVVGCMELAQEALMVDGVAHAHDLLDVGRDELRRAGGILQRLRELSRPQVSGDTKPTDLNELLENLVLVTAKHCEEHAVEVIWTPGPALDPVDAMPERLKQVFLNLILNAVDAMPQGGLLTVRTEQAGPTVRAMVTDTGVGMSPSEVDRLFTAFHTTKADGMGLGLYISKQIVEEHNGGIEIESQPGRGTTFTISLPALGA